MSANPHKQARSDETMVKRLKDLERGGEYCETCAYLGSFDPARPAELGEIPLGVRPDSIDWDRVRCYLDPRLPDDFGYCRSWNLRPSQSAKR